MKQNLSIMRTAFTMLFVCLFLFSCSENEQIYKSDAKNVSIQNYPSIIKGTLSFNSSKELQDLIDYLVKLSVSERKAWEEKHGFYSIRRKTEEAFDALNSAQTEKDFNDCLKKYSDVIELKDSMVVRKIPSIVYQTICSTNGLFITSVNIQKVTPKNIEFYGIESLEELIQGKEVVPFKTIEFNDVELINSKRDPTYLSGEYFDNQSGCNNDRRVYVTAITRKVYTTWNAIDIYGNPFSYTEYTAYVEGNVYGMKRNGLCHWSEYKTLYACSDLTVSVDAFNNSDGKTFLDWVLINHSTSSTIIPTTAIKAGWENASDDYYGMVLELFVGHRALNEGQIYEDLETGFYSCHLEGTSRGIGLYTNWAVINY